MATGSHGELGSADGYLQLRAKVWLAPFDFGIMQHVVIDFTPAKEESGFLTIQVKLVRRSGEANAWGRVNKAFINELRKQLLVWRSLDNATRYDFEKSLQETHNGYQIDHD